MTYDVRVANEKKEKVKKGQNKTACTDLNRERQFCFSAEHITADPRDDDQVVHEDRRRSKNLSRQNIASNIMVQVSTSSSSGVVNESPIEVILDDEPTSKSTTDLEQLVRTSATAWTRLLDIRNGLRAEKSRTDKLKPCDAVNRIFTDLVGFCVHTASTVEELLVSRGAEFERLVVEMREYCGEGESYLEKHWAQKFIDVNGPGYAKRGRLLGGLVRNPLYKPKLPLEKFVYYQNYVDLARIELAALYSVMRHQRLSSNSSSPATGLRLAFVGSGPMPLSSLEIGIQSSAITEIHNIDSDPEAIRMSIELSKIFSFGVQSGTRCTFECADIRDVADLRHFDVVYVAALVGADDAQKVRILTHVHRIMRNGAHLVVRTVRGLRQLLYPMLSMAQLRLAGFDELLEVHPYGGDGVVNSVLIAVKNDRVAPDDQLINLQRRNIEGVHQNDDVCAPDRTDYVNTNRTL